MKPLMIKQGLALALALCLWATAPQAAVFHPESFRLANGLQIVIVKNHLAPAVAHMVWYKAGAADDPAGKSGIAHYLEHLMFKSTANLPAGAYSARIAAEGGQDNAFTTYDYTAYHITAAADRLPLAMQLEAERMRGLLIKDDEARPELDVVKSERAERTDNTPQGLFQERMGAALFPGHPYGRPIIGTRQDLGSLTPQDARDYYRAHYAPANAVLVISGDVDTSEVLRLASATYGTLAGPPAPRALALPKLNAPSQPIVKIEDARVTQPLWQWRIVAPTLKQDAHKAVALEVLAEVLGGGEVGLLYKELVIKSGIASGIDASYDSAARFASVFAVTGTPMPGRSAEDVARAVQSTLRMLDKQGIKESDVRAAKQRMQDAALFARDKLMTPAHVLGEALAVGGSLADVEEWPARVASVKPDEVRAALHALLAEPKNVQGFLKPKGKEAAR